MPNCKGTFKIIDINESDVNTITNNASNFIFDYDLYLLLLKSNFYSMNFNLKRNA